MTEGILKTTHRGFWFYSRALIGLAGCIAIPIIISRWEWGSSLALGLLPLITIFALMGRPSTGRQWLIHILISLLYVAALFPVVSFARAHIRLAWSVPTAIVGIIGGLILFAISLNKRWARWCSDKPFLIPALVLFISFWATMNGAFYVLTRLTGW